jgi:hypothetical protein
MTMPSVGAALVDKGAKRRTVAYCSDNCSVDTPISVRI